MSVAARPSSFADRAITSMRALGHPLCVGLDPHLSQIPPLFRRGSMARTDPVSADAVENFLRAVIDRLAGRVAVVKPQIAFFEQLGWPGLRALARVVERARFAGIEVLLDAKRGDIGSTAEGYAAAYLGAGAALQVDAITLNPYLGLDTLEPFVKLAGDEGCGLFVLVKTSNPGSGDYQDRDLAAGGALYEGVATSLAEIAERLRGPSTGWSSLGVVVGATYPDQTDRVRELLPHSLFLVPGFGAQGASARDAVRGLRPGPAGLEGGIVSSSRAVLFPPAGHTADALAWETAFDDSLKRSIDEISAAAAG